ncbi:glycosyltransferase [Massilia sp. UMI-21]|nr:glycosyltransferase [Massilia sp. UMI-21]
MRIMHLIIGLQIGGAELMLQRLLRAHEGSLNYRHVVVSLTNLGPIGEQLIARGIEVHTLGLRSPLGLPRVMWSLVFLLRRLKADIVQTWMYHADLLGGLAARLAGQRTVIWGIRTTDVAAGNNRSTVAVMRLCATLSRHIPKAIVCAAAASREVHAAAGYDATKMVVVPNGFDVERLQGGASFRLQLRAECGFNCDDTVIGTVGRFNAAKDQQNFVRAAGLIAERHPAVRFLMVGRGLDRANAELEDWISQTGYADRFVLLGERKDIPSCLSAMDLFCLSSRTEGFPNVVGEAMAVGLPCVVTDVGDAALLVGAEGVVVPKENATALAEGLGQVLALSPVARTALGQRAKDRVEAEFTIDRTRQRFEEIYKRVLNIQ